jgi:hypothetical protein
LLPATPDQGQSQRSIQSTRGWGEFSDFEFNANLKPERAILTSRPRLEPF